MKKILTSFLIFLFLLSSLVNIRAQDIPTGKFKGDYYNGRNFDTFVFTREDPAINFDWWRNSPGGGVSKNDFSVRWQGRIEFTEGDWEFAVKVDDGIRMFIDGEKIIESWKGQQVFLKSVKKLSAGSHLIVVEYFETTDWAAIHVNWKKVIPTTVATGATSVPGSTVPTTSPLYNSLYTSSCEDLTIKPATGDAPLEVDFSGAGYDPYGRIMSYIFNFGDKTPIVTQEDSYATHVYDKPGSYKATLTIKDSKGNLRTSDVCTKTITVGGYYKEGIGGYAEAEVVPTTVSALPKTGIFDSALGLIFITIPLAGFGLLLNRKFSKL